MGNNDVALIQRTLSGDEIAFANLVEKYQKEVHTLVYRKIGDFHIAEDITQETFLQVHRKLETLEDPMRFSKWLYVIADRLCIAWCRKNRLQTEPLENPDALEIETEAYSRFAAIQNAQIFAEARRDLIEKLLTKLPESSRTVITLHYFKGMTCTQMSNFLGVSEGTIKSRLRRAQQRLREKKMLTVECYEHVKFNGKKITVLQDIENFQDKLERAGFENNISSIRIIKDLDFLCIDAEVVLHDIRGACLSLRLAPDVSKVDLPDIKTFPIASIKFGG
ncbi:hypothetical protein C6503_06755 [Candidatus Poribacteria bacterium]|nr:MAG: hypothetical protein C6503_06755 [Candidatus Poribacteria bacterium]